MRKQATLVVVATATVLLLALLVSGADRVWFIEEPHRGGDTSETDPRDRVADQADDAPADADPVATDGDLGFWFDIVATIVLGALAILLLTTIFRRTQARRRRRRQFEGESESRRARPNTLAEPIEVPAELVQATAGLDDVILRGTPRNAIVNCWVALEDGCSRAGVARHPAETSVEFTSRVLSTFALGDTSIAELATLYREARFSTHEMTEDHRRAAVEALTEVRAQLRRRPQLPEAEVST